MPTVTYAFLIVAPVLGATNAPLERYVAQHATSGIRAVAEAERSQVYLRYGIIAERDGQLSQALNFYSAAIKADRSSAAARAFRGRLYAKLKDYESALKDLDEAVRLDPDKGITRYMRGNVHFRLHDYQNSVKDYTAFLRSDSSDEIYRYDAYKFRGISSYALIDCVNAKTDLEQALEIDSTDPRGYYYLGLMFYCLGEYEAAASEFRRSMDLGGTSERNTYYLAIWVYLAEERAGVDGHRSLLERSQSLDLSRWPGAVIEMFLGNLQPETLLDVEVQSDHLSEKEILCGKFFYISQFYVLTGDRTTAIDYLTRAIATKATILDEFKAAKTELQRLEDESASTDLNYQGAFGVSPTEH